MTTRTTTMTTITDGGKELCGLEGRDVGVWGRGRARKRRYTQKNNRISKSQHRGYDDHITVPSASVPDTPHMQSPSNRGRETSKRETHCTIYHTDGRGETHFLAKTQRTRENWTLCPWCACATTVHTQNLAPLRERDTCQTGKIEDEKKRP